MSTTPTLPVISQFPADFIWGVATSAFQIEGASTTDGKGPSIWDAFCKVPGAIADSSNGDVACDHYNRLESDLDLIASLGVNAYRFSVSWPRVRPGGSGDWNEPGLQFYDRLVNGLIERGIAPHLTLNHWDLPLELQDQGGWENRDTVQRFVEYAQGIASRFGNRVASIVTHNEPWVVAMLGNEAGIFAPGIKSRKTAIQVSHHLLLSHGLALQAMRAQGCTVPMGLVLNLSPFHPATDSPADIARTRLEDGRLLRWYLDPIYKQSYPEDVIADLGPDAPAVHPGDLEAIATAVDFIGVNYYTRSVVSAGEPWSAKKLGLDVTAMDWEIYPEGLTELLVRLHRDYAIPALIVTENGGAFDDHAVDGRVDDARRTNYLARHIAAVAEAMRQGVPMKGYMVWSLLDNFEWASGYEKRFGIVHVDYVTQVRTPKDSALWYREFLKQQGVVRTSLAPHPKTV